MILEQIMQMISPLYSDPTMAQDGPKRAQDGPKTVPRWAHQRPKDYPKLAFCKGGVAFLGYRAFRVKMLKISPKMGTRKPEDSPR